jgi:hypothetical protein
VTAPTHKPVSQAVVDRFKAYHAQWKGWGNLQLVLGNLNVKDKHVEACKEQATVNQDNEGAGLAAMLMYMSKSQRIKLARSVE